MENCAVIQIITPRKLILNGLWFGPKNPKRVLIFIHGLTSNAFSGHDLVVPLVDESTAVITFSNRGNGKIVRVKRIDKRKKKGHVSLMIGEAHEVFIDCVDDIQGVINHVHSLGTRDIILIGSSTGCQKSAYYLSRKGKQNLIKGVVFLSPLSDYAGALHMDKNGLLARATTIATQYCNEKIQHDLLPLSVWSQMHDAQRFLSLYTPDSEEEIFSYCQKNKIPQAYHSITIPQLVILGEKDETRDRNIKKIAEWFKKNTRSRKSTIEIINGASHSFFQHENEVAENIKSFIKNNSL